MKDWTRWHFGILSNLGCYAIPWGSPHELRRTCNFYGMKMIHNVSSSWANAEDWSHLWLTSAIHLTLFPCSPAPGEHKGIQSLVLRALLKIHLRKVHSALPLLWTFPKEGTNEPWVHDSPPSNPQQQDSIHGCTKLVRVIFGLQWSFDHAH